jgi:spore maturation protein SpmA
MHPQLMHRSLDAVFALFTIQQFWIEVVRVEVANGSVDSFASVLADFGGAPSRLLKEFWVIFPHRW